MKKLIVIVMLALLILPLLVAVARMRRLPRPKDGANDPERLQP